MSGVGSEGEVIEVKDYYEHSDYLNGTRHLLTPTSSFNSYHSSHRVVILYVIGIFLAIVLLLAMGYLLKLNYKTWLPKRKHFCDFRDCFRQSDGKKRKFFQRNSHKNNFTIPVVVVSDPDGLCLDPECAESDEAESKIATKKMFP